MMDLFGRLQPKLSMALPMFLHNILLMQRSFTGDPSHRHDISITTA